MENTHTKLINVQDEEEVYKCKCNIGVPTFEVGFCLDCGKPKS